MGLVPDPAGISVQKYDQNDLPDGAPLFGKFTFLHSRPRLAVVGAGGFTPTELVARGSEDWLTLVAVADSQERLNALVDPAAVAAPNAHSSCASCRVLVKVHVGATEETMEGRTVLASGPVLKLPPNSRVRVTHVKVFHENSIMGPAHPMFDEFTGATVLLNALDNVPDPPAPPD